MTREKEDSYGRRSDDTMEVQTPFGWKLRVNGRIVIVVVMILALGYIVWRHDQRSEESTAAIVQSVQEMAFVLTLTEPERKQLRLTMPVSMRERLLKQERDLRGAEYRRPE